jgi:hypothetical protein
MYTIRNLWKGFIVQNVIKFLPQKEKRKSGKVLFLDIAGN